MIWQRVRQAAAVLLGAVLATSVAPAAVVRDASGLVVEVQSRLPARPGTVLEFPPLGEVRARTHHLPVELRLRLSRVEPAAVQALASARSPEDYRRLEEGLRQSARRAVLSFLARQGALAAAGGALGGYLARAAGWGLAGAALAAGAGVVGLGAVLAAGYDVAAFETPVYRGVLEAAPQLVETARQGMAAIGGVSRRVVDGVTQLAQLYRHLQAAGPAEGPRRELVVAHVSDLHNHPSAYELLSAVIEQFGVELVIDTGDLADFESPLETSLMARLQGLQVPYVLVPGNHDYPEALQALRSIPGVQVADGSLVRAAGLTILGWPDPGSSSRSARALSGAEARALAGQINAELARLASEGQAVDVVAVHHDATGVAIEPGLAPVVLFGHDHVLRMERRGGTVYVDAGSTGARGLRGLQAGDDPPPFTLALLRFDRSGQRPRLWAVDLLSLDAVSGELSLTRTLAGGPRRKGMEGEEPPLGAGARGGRAVASPEIRTFVAVELEPVVRRRLREQVEKLRPHVEAALGRVRWVAEEQYHVTLRFLGELPAERVAAVRSTVQRVCAETVPFEVSPCCVGRFPPQGLPRVLWVGFDAEGGRRLGDLARRLETALQEAGFPPAREGFVPHLTIARVKQIPPHASPGRGLGARWAAVDPGLLGPVGSSRILEAVVMRSDLNRQGARYTPLYRLPLQGTGPEGSSFADSGRGAQPT